MREPGAGRARRDRTAESAFQVVDYAIDRALA
jgi:hypothetical protein